MLAFLLFAGVLHVVVVAGLSVGNKSSRDALSGETKRYLFGFWTLIDEMLNSVLFLLIRLEVLVLRFEPAFGWLMALSLPEVAERNPRSWLRRMSSSCLP
jgi:CPA1 family monovalent cation:H+ antiporter